MQRFGHLSIAGIFLLFIYVPLVLSVVLDDLEVSMAEKRRLAKLPRPELTIESLEKFPDQYETYYNDHFGLREQFVVFYNYLYFNILRKSSLPSVTVGRDGWLFYNAEGVLLDFLGLQEYSVEQLETWKRTIEDREEWLGDMGIRYLFVVAPYKMMIYPEKLPERVRRQAGVTLLERLRDYLGRHATVESFMDLRPDLLAAKSRRQVYYRTDTHWNPDGAFDAYTSIMQRLRQWFPDVKILSEISLDRTTASHRGDICITLNLNSIAPEQTVKSVVSPSCGAESYDKVHVGRGNGAKRAEKPDYLPVRNGCPGAPRKALVIHDSFGLFLRPYFNESFGEVIYSNYMDLKDLKELIRRERPDVVIDVRVARHLRGMLEEDPEMERAMLEKHAEVSSDVRLRLDRDNGNGSLGAIRDLAVERVPDGLLLRATGSDPSLEITFDALTDGDPLLVSLSMVSPQDTELEIFYTTPDAPEFSASRRIQRKIVWGANDLLFRLPHPHTGNRIRFDPGMAEGDYLLRSLVVLRESREEKPAGGVR